MVSAMGRWSAMVSACSVPSSGQSMPALPDLEVCEHVGRRHERVASREQNERIARQLGRVKP